MSLLNSKLTSTISAGLEFIKAANRWIANSVVMGGPESWLRFSPVKRAKANGDQSFTAIRYHEVLTTDTVPKRLNAQVDIRVRYANNPVFTPALLSTLVTQTAEQITNEHITELDRGQS